MTKKPPVIAFTRQGKLQVFLIKWMLNVVTLVQRWQFPKPNFEENPRYFTLDDVTYFAYKYYHTQIKQSEDPDTAPYFLNQKFDGKNDSCQLSISLGGDLMPYATITPDKCDDLWNNVGEFFFSSDIVFANLETPVDLTKEPGLVPEVMLKEMLFNGSEEIFNIFNGGKKFKGFDVLSVANNHALDQGVQGLQQTLLFLKKKQIAYCGAATSADTLHDFPVVVKNEISVAFLAFTFSLNEFDLPKNEGWRCNHIRLNKVDADIHLILQQATVARERGADNFIAFLHMGNAYQAYPSKHIQNTIQRICRESGIDVVVAGHPHNPQPVEWFHYSDSYSIKRKSLIFYSLGDFVAYDIYSWAHLALLIKLRITKVGLKAQVSGFEILPTYMTATFHKNKVNKLVFQHVETVYANREQYTNHLREDIESVYELYDGLLFSRLQRSTVVAKVTST